MLKTKQYDKVIIKFYCSVKVRAKKKKLGRQDSFQIWMVDYTWDAPCDNALIFLDLLENVWIIHRRPDLIFRYQSTTQHGGYGELIKQYYQIDIWKVSVVIDNAVVNVRR